MEGTPTKAIIGLAVGVLLIAYIGSVAISAIFGTNTDSWDTATAGLWTVLAIVVLIAFFLLILKYADIV